jgi:hypothetical protein
MIWVRLIGGCANGKVAKVDPDQMQHIAEERRPVVFLRATSLNSPSVEVKRTVYTRREVRSEAGTIVYFADQAMSDYAALQSVLGP